MTIACMVECSVEWKVNHCSGILLVVPHTGATSRVGDVQERNARESIASLNMTHAVHHSSVSMVHHSSVSMASVHSRDSVPSEGALDNQAGPGKQLTYGRMV